MSLDFFHLRKSSGRTITQATTQPEYVGRNVSRCVRLTILPPSRVDCHEIGEFQLSGILRACPDQHKSCFTFALPISTRTSPSECKLCTLLVTNPKPLTASRNHINTFVLSVEENYVLWGTNWNSDTAVAKNIFSVGSWLMWSVASLSPRRLEFKPEPVHAKYVVNKLPLNWFFRVLRFSDGIIIPPLIHTHSSSSRTLLTKGKTTNVWRPSNESHAFSKTRKQWDRRELSL